MKAPKKHVNHERWLVSYADFVTLLFAFFVVLFAYSQADKKKQQQVAKAMTVAFTEMGVFDPHSKTPALTDSTGAGAEPVAPPVPGEETPQQLKDHIDRILSEQVKMKHISEGSVTTHIGRDGLVISLHEAGFFASGSAEVNPSSTPMLTALVDALPPRPIRVEGHTDNIPIHTAQFATNWELSTARASAIARFVIDRGTINPADVAAAGYAEFHPVATNDTQEGRTQNRRVDIILLTGQAASR